MSKILTIENGHANIRYRLKQWALTHLKQMIYTYLKRTEGVDCDKCINTMRIVIYDQVVGNLKRGIFAILT